MTIMTMLVGDDDIINFDSCDASMIFLLPFIHVSAKSVGDYAAHALASNLPLAPHILFDNMRWLCAICSAQQRKYIILIFYHQELVFFIHHQDLVESAAFVAFVHLLLPMWLLRYHTCLDTCSTSPHTKKVVAELMLLLFFGFCFSQETKGQHGTGASQFIE